MNFEELSDDEWMQIAALVSDEPPIRLNRRGRPRAEPRVVANAVLWILTTGESWSRLPARYPSGPTCRRRFDDWNSNGTLVELVQLLSQRGRTFAYVPQAAPPSPQPVADVVEPAEDDGLPSVFWKSPEAWQAPPAATGSAAHEAPVVADPMESITRQLSNVGPERVDDKVGTRGAIPQPRAYAQSMPPAPVSPRNEIPPASRGTLWGGASGEEFVQEAEWRGFTMNLGVQEVREHVFRASVEIVKDGQRIERSGLIGPAFDDRDEAEQFAFDWGRTWVEQYEACPVLPTMCADHVQDVPRSPVVTRTANDVVTRPAPAAQSAAGMSGPARLAPLHRFSSAGGLPSCADSLDGGASGSGSVERRTAAQRLRSHAG